MSEFIVFPTFCETSNLLKFSHHHFDESSKILPEGRPTSPWRKNFEVDQSSRGPLAQQPDTIDQQSFAKVLPLAGYKNTQQIDVCSNVSE